MQTITYANGDKKQYDYDALGRLRGYLINGIRHTDYNYFNPNDARVAHSGKVAGIETSYFTYTDTGATEVKNANAHATAYYYAPDNQNIKNIYRSATNSCPFAYAKSETAPNSKNLLYKEDWKGNRASYTYDTQNRVQTEYFNGKTKENLWDAQNRIIHEKYWDGAISGVTCKSGEVCPSAGGTPIKEIIYTYYGAEKNNRLQSETIKDDEQTSSTTR